MSLSVREPDNLVFDARAVAWAARANGSAVHRRFVDMVGDNLLGRGIGEGDPAGELFKRSGACGVECRPAVVEIGEFGILAFQRGVVHRPTVDTRRRSRLEALDRQSNRCELFGQVCGALFARAPAGERGVGANMDAATEESARGDDHGARAEATSLHRLHPAHRGIARGKQQLAHSALHQRNSRMLLEERTHGPSIQPAIRLRARGPDGGPLSAIEHSELNGRTINSASHDAAKGVDLADDSSLGHPADRGIARHLPDCLHRARDERHTRAATDRARRGHGGFGAGVPTANDDDVVRRLHRVIGRNPQVQFNPCSGHSFKGILPACHFHCLLAPPPCWCAKVPLNGPA